MPEHLVRALDHYMAWVIAVGMVAFMAYGVSMAIWLSRADQTWIEGMDGAGDDDATGPGDADGSDGADNHKGDGE